MTAKKWCSKPPTHEKGLVVVYACNYKRTYRLANGAPLRKDVGGKGNRSTLDDASHSVRAATAQVTHGHG